MKAPRRLVVRGVNWLGDAIMSLPALARLREALPGTHIALLTADKLAGLWHGCRPVDEVIPFRKQQGVLRVSKILRAGRFDAALVLPNSFRSALEVWLAGIQVRVGYGRPWLLSESVRPRAEHVAMRKRTAAEIKRLAAEHPDGRRQSFPREAHHLHQYLRLASRFGASEEPLRPALVISPDERAAFIRKFGVGAARPLIGLNPGAEYGPAKRWPHAHFVAAADRAGGHFLIFGGPGDAEAALQIETGLRERNRAVLNLAGQTSLRELAAGLALCDAVLTNDTGPMHLAAAAGTRVVVPFGSTSPELTGPGIPGDARHRLLPGQAPCAPCFLRVCPIDFRCMQSIPPSAVAEALAELTQPAPGSH